ncbi:MAG: hypothetical protein F4112_15555 [Holophagales bacterium]|nr:hypothetical protein [Holophagales bacterium]MYD23072.1 hypothetical protein [Holophagales bacterium]MYI34363.1 hypothetical protein [Holophagales bacterium]
MRSGYTVAIIGGGASGVALAARIVEHLPAGLSTANLSIALFDARGCDGGNAYAPDAPSNLMNTTCGAIDRVYGGSFGILEWAEENPGKWQPYVERADLEAGAYIPRPVVGLYLSDLLDHARRQAADRGFCLDLVVDEVIDISPPGDPDAEYVVHSRAGGDCKARYVYLAVGHLERCRTEDYQHQARYRHNPYPIAGLVEEIPERASVGVIGTRLTAIDVALGLAAAGHAGSIHCVSRRGRLPAVRADRGKYRFKELEREDLRRRLLRETRSKLRLSDIAAMLGREIEHAEGRHLSLGEIVHDDRSPIDYYEREIALAAGRARPWQAVLYATNRNIDLLWHHLHEDDRQLLMSEWLNDWLTYRASIPRENAERVLAMMKSGQLTVQGGARKFEYDSEAGSFRIQLASGGPLQVEYLVSATGFANRIEQADSRLMKNLLSRGLVVPHRYGGVDCVFETGQVRPRAGAAAGESRIFALGPLTSGVYFFTTALEIIARQAAQRTHDLAFMLGVEWLDQPETEAWVDDFQAGRAGDAEGPGLRHGEGPDLLGHLLSSDQTEFIDFKQLRLLNDQIRDEDFETAVDRDPSAP